MKIGILTLPFNNNYGGLLQSYALHCYLVNRGHEVYSIQQPICRYRRKIKLFLKQKFKVGNYINSSNIEKFQHRYFQETFPVYKDEDFKRLNKIGFDTVIVGSDQVWRFEYTKEKYQRYFLNFINNKHVRKIAYAASFGVDYWEADKEKTRIAAQLLKQFDAVSVREKSGVDLCRDFLNQDNVISLLDPTLLMPADFYRGLYTGEEKSQKGGVGYYFLDESEDKQALLRKIKERFSLPSFCIGKKKIESKRKGRGVYYPSVSQWIKDFDEANYIVTDSYHGMLFSIIFRKPFLVIGNSKRGWVRFSSFLEMLNLEGRLLMDHRDIEINDRMIYDDHLLEKIREMREKTRVFFKDNGL
nr:polysaccharide pyruvyl transferase family protein [uncultured Desulfobacter sp.]